MHHRYEMKVNKILLSMDKDPIRMLGTGARPPPIVFPPPSWEIDDETYNKSPEPSELSKEPPITIARRIGALIDLYTGPRPPHVVFPPPSWEIDEETYKESPEPSELSTVPLISFARRMGALIDSLPTFPSAVAASLASSSSRAPPIQDDGKQDSPVHPEIDKDLIRMLGSEEVMNGQVINDTKSNPKGKKTPQQTGNVWNILASLKSNIALKRSETPSPSAVEEDDGSVMMYAPLEPTNDSKLELAESLLEYVDDPLPPASTESDERIEGSDASTSPTLPTPARKGREKLKWVPSKTKISLLGTWWGYRLYLPPPVMAKLNGMSLEAAARAAMLTTALKWALNKIPLMLIPVQFRPAVKMLRMLSPIVGYVGVFIAWSWDRVKSLDEGKCLTFTSHVHWTKIIGFRRWSCVNCYLASPLRSFTYVMGCW